MKTFNVKYIVEEDAQVLARAKKLGYKERVADESLFVDGKIPMVQATNEDGTPRVEMDIEWSTDGEDSVPEKVSETPRLDEAGEEIPVMVQMDVMIDNPTAPEVFMVPHIRKVLADFMTVDIEKDIMQAARLETEVIEKTAKATAKATKDAVAESIAVTIS
jgi:hypothetical protein